MPIVLAIALSAAGYCAGGAWLARVVPPDESVFWLSAAGVFIAYEARKSLWTMGRQNAVMLIAISPMLAAIHLCYAYIGLGLALAAGWAVFLPLLYMISRPFPFRRSGAHRAAAKHSMADRDETG